MFTRVLGRYIAFTDMLIPKPFRGAPTESVDSCAEIKSAPSVALPVLAEFRGRFRKEVFGVCTKSSPLSAILRVSIGQN